MHRGGGRVYTPPHARTCRAPPWRTGYYWYLPGVEDRDGLWVYHGLYSPNWRALRVGGGDGDGKVIPRAVGHVLVEGIMQLLWRRSGGPSNRYLNDKCLISTLSSGKILVEYPHHDFIGTEQALCAMVPLDITLPVPIWPRVDPQVDIWRIKRSPQRVAVFPQNSIPYIVDQIFFTHADSRR